MVKITHGNPPFLDPLAFHFGGQGMEVAGALFATLRDQRKGSISMAFRRSLKAASDKAASGVQSFHSARAIAVGTVSPNTGGRGLRVFAPVICPA